MSRNVHTHTARGGEPDPNRDREGTPTSEKLPDGQYKDHWVLPPEERAKGYVRPMRVGYVHEKCGVQTRMPLACAETYAREPTYYGSTFCCGCGGYFPVGPEGEFVWDDGSKVGS